MTEQSQPQSQPESQALSSGYLLLVGVLLITIIASLAVLWVRERNARIEAQKHILPPDVINSGLVQLLAKEQAQAVHPVKRAQLATQPAVLDGHPVTAIQLNASDARRFGFAPGDVIIVLPEPASLPATAPAAP